LVPRVLLDYLLCRCVEKEQVPSEVALVGGHSVPEEVIRRRYAAGLRTFFDLYQSVVDIWQMFDNTHAGQARLAAAGRAGKPTEILDHDAWINLLERQQ
jgi:predicted ABC-type ATPase